MKIPVLLKNECNLLFETINNNEQLIKSRDFIFGNSIWLETYWSFLIQEQKKNSLTYLKKNFSHKFNSLNIYQEYKMKFNNFIQKTH